MKELLKNRFSIFWLGLRAIRAGIRAGTVSFASSWRDLSAQCKIRRLLKERDEILLEIGAGDKRGNGGWVTIDVLPNCDICWDLMKGLPFPDGTVTEIYSSHVFEHFSFREGQRLFDECRRVLSAGGKFSICVPNAKLYIDAYAEARQLDDKFFAWKPAYNNTTRIDYVNHIAFMDGHHKYMFDEENLLYILKLRGFRNVRARQFDPRIDREERDSNSIYAEAEK